MTSSSYRLPSDWPLATTLLAGAIISGLILFFVCAFVIWESSNAIIEIGFRPFVFDQAWSPTSGFYGMVPMFVASLLAMLGSVIIAAPISFGAALFLSFASARKTAICLRRIIELMAGIPSVVYGLWGLVVLVPIINQWHAPGTSLLAAILILSIMILPMIALTADAAFQSIPRHQLAASRALGVGFRGMLELVIWPFTRIGIYSGVLLAAARALGETMAVLLVSGNIPQIPHSIFDPIRTLTTNMAIEMAYAMGRHRSALFVSGCAIVLLVLSLVLFADWLKSRSEKVLVSR